MNTKLRRGVLHHRHLAGNVHAESGLRYVDCVRTADGRVRLFCGAGTRSRDFAAPPRIGALVVEEAGEIHGTAMLCLHGSGPLVRSDGLALTLEPTVAEPQIFAGKATLMGSRMAETPEQITDWLRYHSENHGAEAALLLNRAPQDDGFAADLEEAVAALGMVVVLLESPFPLGVTSEPGQHDLPLARAKQRQETQEPDPWRSALAEPLIFEALKWRFLSDAAAVLQIDCCDLLAPDGPNAFAACRTVPGGVVALRGTPCYPWRIKDAAARFGDHICRRFDARPSIARWGVAPRRAGLNRIWRPARISGTPPDVTVLTFWRAMCVRVPNRAISQLVSKTELIEDPALLEMSLGPFGHTPVRAVTSDLRDVAAVAPHKVKTTVITCMRNEGPFLLEWIAYHRVAGVTNFVIYTNNCTDGTDTYLALLQRKGLCEHRANSWSPGSPGNPQVTAYAAAETEPTVTEADWLICMDADEFINVKIGDGTLPALYAAMGEANVISLTWRLFGDSGVVAYQDIPIIEQFTRCAPELIRKPHQAWGFKTLFRNNGIFRKFGVHRPKGLKPEHWEKVRWLNGSGRPMPDSILRDGWRSTLTTYGYDWVQLNHYAVRSVESFLAKRDRGRAHHVGRDLGQNYWFRMSHNVDEDRSIQRMLPAVSDEMRRLLSDPDIAEAQAQSVARHREKIAELMERPDQRAFYGDLTGERMRRLTRMQKHFGSAVFLIGPHVIPDEVALDPNLPQGFFFTVEGDGSANV